MSQTIRTYKEAVEITVKWWAEKSFKTLINQNNGDQSPNGGIGFILMNRASSAAQAQISEESIQKFEQKLTEILLEKEGKGRHSNRLDVDYDPNQPLREACNYAGISTLCLPCKTFTWINDQNEVEGRYQYRGDWFKL